MCHELTGEEGAEPWEEKRGAFGGGRFGSKGIDFKVFKFGEDKTLSSPNLKHTFGRRSYLSG